jgi:ABC-type branched-subunit amino acid transport system substrate-binding protein
MDGDDERAFLERQVDREISRRTFTRWGAKLGMSSFALAAFGGALAACSSGGDDSAPPPPGGAQGCEALKGTNDNLKIGCIGVFSGPGAFIGRIVQASLDAAVAQINKGGGVGGRKVEWLKKDIGLDATAQVKIYNEYASSPDIAGVLVASAFPLGDLYEQIAKDNMPVISCYTDLESGDELYKGPGTKGNRQIFQFAPPDRWAHEAALQYAKDDRGYRSAAHMYDSLLDPNGSSKEYFDGACAKAGIQNLGSETFRFIDSEYGQQLQRLKGKRPDLIYIDGVSQNTATIAGALQQLRAEYRDRDAVLGNEWHPHLFGSPAGTGERTWADLAGDAAKTGTITAWHVGGLIALPQFKIRAWMKEFGTKGFPTGGEELPADSLYTLTKAIDDAQCLDREAIITAIENGGRRSFASVDFDFTATNHLARTRDDVIMVVLEKNGAAAATTPPYALGREFTDPLPAGYTGPAHLVRPTLAANTRRYPDVMKVVLEQGYGTQCTKTPADQVGAGVTLTKDCKIH